MTKIFNRASYIDLTKALRRHYGGDFSEEWTPLKGGYENDVYHVADYVVCISPPSRTAENLQWTHMLTRHCAEAVPQVIAPIAAIDGTTVLMWQGRAVSVFPFIAGDLLDLRDMGLVRQAARLLGEIHTAGLGWDKPKEPSPTGTASILDQPIPDEAAYLHDDALDAWVGAFFARDDLIIGPVHGDYYRGNILCADGGAIRGIIDWDESEIRPILTEIAWATWEFTHNAAGDDLDMARARDFLHAYGTTCNLFNQADKGAIIPLIRRHLRYEIRRSILAERRGESVDLAYQQAEMRAFQQLRGKTL